MHRLLSLALLSLTTVHAIESIDLSGLYRLHLQSTGGILIPAGDEVADPSSLMFDDTITLPGTTDLAGKGPRVTTDRPFEYHLSREYDHLGPAYYKRSITIPADWENQEAELFLERVMWQSRVWVDGKEVSPPQDSLNTPHIHPLGVLAPGQHDLVIRVDNRMIHPIGDKGHAYGAQTQSIWNGVVGRMELRKKPLISQVRVFPALDGTVKVEVTGDIQGTLTASIDDASASAPATSPTSTLKLKIDQPVLWSEFSPKVYQVVVKATGSEGKVLDSHTTSFGFRSVAHDGNKLLINDKPAFMRGNLECAVFPKTGHPPTDVESWRKIWQVYQQHNLNHARFHSWCPPEAAFIAADEMGIYLQVEAPIWIDGWMTQPNRRKEMDTKGYPQGLGKNDRSIDEFAQAEIRRTIDTYGNHPSFVFFAIGNELGTSNFDVTGTWMRDAKAHDPRHLYAASTARTITPYCGFNATHNIPGIGWTRQHVEFGTNWDYENTYGKAQVPIIAHEIGQWPVYVDWATELPKYTGPLKPYRLAKMAEQAKETGLYDRARELRQASGATNRILYRYEIESFLRTPSCRGFQLLSMQDFSGQGEALVGWLDGFYDSKGTTDPAEFRHYCAPTVPLLKLPGYVFRSSDKPTIEALVHHFGEDDLTGKPVTWSLTGPNEQIIQQGELNPPSGSIANGGLSTLGTFLPDLGSVQQATPATLTIAIGDNLTNTYQIWIYPDKMDTEPTHDVVMTTDWFGVAKPALEAGKPVVLSAHLLGEKRSARLASWSPLYWSVPFFPGQNIETIGLLVHHDHPAFAKFPTPSFADWNWFRLCQGARGFDLTDITARDYRAIAEPVSDFHYNRRIGSIFEFKVGKGKLLVSGYNLSDANAAKLPEAAQLRRSLLDYAASTAFDPKTAMETASLDKLFESVHIKLPPLAKEFEKADLYVNAAGKLPVTDQLIPWSAGLDHVLRKAEGVDYRVQMEGLWRDEQGTAWVGKKLSATIHPRSGVPGKLRVRFHDWNRNGRTGKLTFEGKASDLGAHTDGVWIEFPVIREDTNDGELILTAEALTGPNLMITDIAFLPEE